MYELWDNDNYNYISDISFESMVSSETEMKLSLKYESNSIARMREMFTKTYLLGLSYKFSNSKSKPSLYQISMIIYGSAEHDECNWIASKVYY